MQPGEFIIVWPGEVLSNEAAKLKLRQLFLSDDEIVRRFVLRFLKKKNGYNYTPLLIKDYNLLVRIEDKQLVHGSRAKTRFVTVEDYQGDVKEFKEITLDESVLIDVRWRTTSIELPFVSFLYWQKGCALTSRFGMVLHDEIISRVVFDIRDKSCKIQGLFKDENLFKALDTLEYSCDSRLAIHHGTDEEVAIFEDALESSIYQNHIESLGLDVKTEWVQLYNGKTPSFLLHRLCFANLDPMFQYFAPNRADNDIVYQFIDNQWDHGHNYVTFKRNVLKKFRKMDVDRLASKVDKGDLFSKGAVVHGEHNTFRNLLMY